MRRPGTAGACLARRRRRNRLAAAVAEVLRRRRLPWGENWQTCVMPLQLQCAGFLPRARVGVLAPRAVSWPRFPRSRAISRPRFPRVRVVSRPRFPRSRAFFVSVAARLFRCRRSRPGGFCVITPILVVGWHHASFSIRFRLWCRSNYAEPLLSRLGHDSWLRRDSCAGAASPRIL